MRNLLRVAILAASALGLSPAIAAAHGSATIAGAPELTLGSNISSGWSEQPINGATGGEFWKVPMKGGDTLTFNVSEVAGVTSASCLEVWMYSPTATDATLPSTTPSIKYNVPVTFVAPYTGTWYLFVGNTAFKSQYGGCEKTTVTYSYLAAITTQPTVPAAGSATISAAPNLILNQTVSSGWSNQPVNGATGGEFWKVSMNQGDTLDFSVPTAADGVNSAGCLSAGIYPPTATDATLPSVKAETFTDHPPLTFVAPATGAYTLFVGNTGFNSQYYGCEGSTVAYNYLAAFTAPAPAATPAPSPTSTLAIGQPDAKVSRTGALAIDVTCTGAPCTGTLEITTTFKTSDKHRRRHTTTVDIGSVSFSGLNIGTHKIKVQLNKIGLHLLTKDDYKLDATARVTYTAGSTTLTTRSTVSLKGTKPKRL